MSAPPDESDVVTYPSDIAWPAAQIGGVAGVAGLTVGSIAGVLRTSTPVLFSIVSGLQWTALGGTYWGIRSSILQREGLLNWWALTRGLPLKPRNDFEPTPRDKVYASSIAGGLSAGIWGGIFRGPRNIIPGIVMFSLFGFAGQHAHSYLDARHLAKVTKPVEVNEQPKANLMQRMAKSKWSPLRELPDDEYENILKEKLLKIETEVALIDDRIENLKKAQGSRPAIEAQNKSVEKEA
jgi:hypothetical protein